MTNYYHQTQTQRHFHRTDSQNTLHSPPNTFRLPYSPKIKHTTENYLNPTFQHSRPSPTNYKLLFTSNQFSNKYSNQSPKLTTQDKNSDDIIRQQNILSTSNKSPKSKILMETSATTYTELIFKNKKNPYKQIPTFLKQKSNKFDKKSNGITKLQLNNFEIIKKLGEGKFGTVLLVKQKLTGFILAIKAFQKNKIVSSNFINQFIRQLKIQSFLNHPSIIEIYGLFSDDDYFYTLMQFGCHGQLYDFMTTNINFSQEATSFIVKNLLQSANFMHSYGILHRDIKPQNIVLIHGTVKLCDFGWSVKKQTKYQLRETFCGTPLYLSPQLIIGAKYDQKVDLWAIGILSFQLLTKSSPFQIKSKQDLYKIVTAQIIQPENILLSIEYYQFISKILKKNPNQRPTASNILKMKFITNYQQLETCELLCH